MFVGRVIGTVWSTVKWPQVQGLKLMLVRPYHLADLADRSAPAEADKDEAPPATAEAPSPSPRGGPDCEAVVCVDLLDAGVGDDVVVAFGHAARVAAQSADAGPGPQVGGPAASSDYGSSVMSAIVPIDAAIVAVVDRIAVARPST